MNNLKLIFLIFSYLLCSVSNSNAYIDPGTGSIILQALLAFIAGAAATISLWWENFKTLIKKILKLKVKNNKKNFK